MNKKRGGGGNCSTRGHMSHRRGALIPMRKGAIHTLHRRRAVIPCPSAALPIQDCIIMCMSVCIIVIVIPND